MTKILYKISFVFFVLSFVLINSCRKKKLKGRYENLVGEWVWDYSIGVYKTGPYSTSQDTFVPTKDSYSLNFQKKGILEFKKNNIVIDEIYLKPTGDDSPCEHCYYSFKGTYNGSELVFKEIFDIYLFNKFYPFNLDSLNGNKYIEYGNYFLKVN